MDSSLFSRIYLLDLQGNFQAEKRALGQGSQRATWRPLLAFGLISQFLHFKNGIISISNLEEWCIK